MAHVHADHIRETTAVTGTGAVTPLGAVAGNRAFSVVLANADTFDYCIQEQTPGAWETGVGTWNSGAGTFTRSVHESSNSNSAVSFSAGTKDVFITPTAYRVTTLAASIATNTSNIATNTSDIAARLPLAGGTMTGSITSTIGTITTNQPALTATQTWNDGAVTFKGIFLNVTNTASAGGSRLLDLQVASSSKFSVTTGGNLACSGTISSDTITAGGFVDSASRFSLKRAGGAEVGLLFGSGQWIAWSSTGFSDGSLDIGIARSSAGLAEVNNGVVGTFRDLKLRDIYSTNATYLHRTAAALTDGAAASIGTLTNAPAAGNPTKWIAIDDNGTPRYIPAW